ncbi:MAG: serine protease [Proteobacteria bacterium]|nr:serine protease [Desulfobacula sp.]MBU3953448.1 serine protease [Pseudomonadota bacterium]
MKVYILPVALQILGVLVIVAEIFIPSLGLLMAIALGLFGYSLYLAFTTISSFAGMVFLGLDLLVVPVLLILGMKVLAASPLSLKNQLSSKDGVVSQTGSPRDYLDKQGLSVTDLRPSGIALIEGKRLDVVTDGEYLDAQTPVIVTRVTGNQIIVEKNNRS